VFKLRVLVVSLALLLALTLTHAATNAAMKLDPANPNSERIGLLLSENQDLTRGTSVIYARSDRSSDLNFRKCSSMSDEICTRATEINTTLFFKMCLKETDTNCIATVWTTSPMGAKTFGNYVGLFQENGAGDFPGEPGLSLPAGQGNSFVIDLPGVNHEGGTSRYLVSLRKSFVISKLSGELARNSKVDVQGLMGAITPFKVEAGNQYRPIVVGEVQGSSHGSLATPNGTRCFATREGECAAIVNFPSNYRFGMSVRLSEKLSGWFHGRITSPAITTSQNNLGSILNIEAAPVKVATVDFVVPKSSLDKATYDFIFSQSEFGAQVDQEGTKIIEDLANDRTQDIMRRFTPYFGDKASKTDEFWSFRTLAFGSSDAVSRCSDGSGDLAGVVTTNSLLYSAGPPSFNSSEGSLDYRVSSPHFESNGKEASGTYDLLLRSDVARCIYGFTSAPIKASIEVLSSDGTSKVASTVINEQDGWLKMSASGFGFSSPIVRAKITQEKVEAKPTPSTTPTLAPIASPTPVAVSSAAPSSITTSVASAKKKAIICVKGSSTKKITGQNPKCPQGWKKKV